MLLSLLLMMTSIGNPPPVSTLDLFPSGSFQTLHIYSCKDCNAKEIDMGGVPLPCDEYAKIYQGKQEDYKGYYAIMKFQYSNGLMAYLVREPSQYESSKVVMYIFSLKDKKAIASIQLADEYGDGEWFFERNAWLIKKAGSFTVIIKELNSSQEEDDPEKGDHVWVKVLFFLKGSFRRVPSNERIICKKHELKHNEEYAKTAQWVKAP